MTPPVAATPPTPTGIFHPELPIAAIVPSTTNPRTHFAEAYIDELARSIADKGLIQPLILRPNGKAGTFEIVAGECRWRASKRAGLGSVPAIVREYTDEQALEVQLIENIHRTDLTPLEQSIGYRALITSNPDKHSYLADQGYSRENFAAIAKKYGVDLAKLETAPAAAVTPKADAKTPAGKAKKSK